MDEIKEIERIRNSYVEKEETNVDRLKKLDNKVKNFPMIFCLAFGVVSSLIMGAGMSILLGSLELSVILGYTLGILGLALMIINPFIYRAILQSRKNKYGQEIIQLSDEILND